MFSNIGFGELVMIGVLGLVIFGPERLPKAAGDAVRLIRQLRAMADSAVGDLKAELPADLAGLDLRSMNPRTLITNAVFDSHGRPADILDVSGSPDPHRGEDFGDATDWADDDDAGTGQTTLLDADLRPASSDL